MKKLILGTALVVALLLAGCAGSPKNAEHAEAPAPAEDHAGEIVFSHEQAAAAGLEIETVTPAPFSAVIPTSGEVRSAQGDEATIVATTNGVVLFPRQALTLGAPIAAGATVVTISAKNLADGDPSVKAKLAYDTALKEYERAKGLVADQIISTKEFDQVRLRYENARTSYEALSANVTSSGVRVASPIGGYLTSRLVAQGDYVTVGQPLATVSQNRRLQLQADVPPSQFDALRTVQSANFITPYDDNLYKLSSLDGRLLSVGKSSDKSSFYIPVTFEFNNTGSIVPGSFVEVYLLGAPQPDVISVPRSGLTEEQGIYFVYVQIDDDGYMKREVKLGSDNGERVRILSGLTEGDRVVTKGAYEVKLAASSSIIPEGHTHH